MEFNFFVYHYVIKALNEANVVFPITKNKLLEKVAGIKISNGSSQPEPFDKVLSGLPESEYENGVAFMCALTAMMGATGCKEWISKYSSK